VQNLYAMASFRKGKKPPPSAPLESRNASKMDAKTAKVTEKEKGGDTDVKERDDGKDNKEKASLKNFFVRGANPFGSADSVLKLEGAIREYSPMQPL